MIHAGLARQPGFTKIVDAWDFPILFGSIRLSYFLIAAVMGRPDLRARFVTSQQWDWRAVLRWLVLHGIRELRLWPFLSKRFVMELRAPSIFSGNTMLSPLHCCVISERPDVLNVFLQQQPASVFRSHFRDWLLTTGVSDYGLWWVLTETEMRAREARNAVCCDIGGISGDDATAWPRVGVDFADAGTTDRGHYAQGSRPHYEAFGANYPYLFLDLSQPEAVARAFVRGQVRLAAESGIELISPNTSIPLPISRYSSMAIILDMTIPEHLRRSLWVKFRIEGHIEKVISASWMTGEPLNIPVSLSKAGVGLDISFSQAAENSGFGPTPAPYALLRSVGVWQVRA